MTAWATAHKRWPMRCGRLRVVRLLSGLLCGPAFADPIIGGIAASAYYIGREKAQAEERYMMTKRISRAMSPCCMVLKREAWNVKSVLDWVLPLVVFAAFHAAFYYGATPLFVTINALS